MPKGKPPTPADFLRIAKDEGILKDNPEPEPLRPGLHVSVKASLCCPECGSTTVVDPKSAAAAHVWVCLVCSAFWMVDYKQAPSQEGTTVIMPLKVAGISGASRSEPS